MTTIKRQLLEIIDSNSPPIVYNLNVDTQLILSPSESIHVDGNGVSSTDYQQS